MICTNYGTASIVIFLSKVMRYENYSLFCQSFWTKKRIPLKKIILSLVTGCILFASCRKDIFVEQQSEPCEQQTADPAGRSYSSDSVINYNCTTKHCGFIPLSSKNYWVYEDSIFTDGILQKVQFDTLRFSSNLMSLPDGLVWWKSNLNIGLPEILFANDSAFFGLEDRLYAPNVMEAKKGFSMFEGDSIKYITSFEDAAAIGRSLKIESDITTPTGTYNNYLYFEKNARNYRKDQIFFKPGIGVLKYIREKAQMGERIIKPEQILTLVSYHIE